MIRKTLATHIQQHKAHLLVLLVSHLGSLGSLLALAGNTIANSYQPHTHQARKEDSNHVTFTDLLLRHKRDSPRSQLLLQYVFILVANNLVSTEFSHANNRQHRPTQLHHHHHWSRNRSRSRSRSRSRRRIIDTRRS